MDRFFDALSFPVPEWLAAHTEPNIEAMVSLLGPETERLYRRFLAEEVRAPRQGALLPPCLSAFDRATCAVECHSRERPLEHWQR